MVSEKFNFFWGGVVSPMPTPSYPGGPMIFCWSCLPQLTSPNFEASGTRFSPLHYLAI